MKLSIIIVNYNTKDLLKDCIDSINLNPPGYPYEIIVIDNNSSDGSRGVINGYPNVVKIFNTENLGFARANNIGIRMAKGDYELLLNSDTLVLAGSLDKMIKYMDEHSKTGILGPKLTGKNGEIVQASWDFQPTIFWEIIRRILSPENINKFPISRYIVGLLQRKTMGVPVITAASMFIRKVVFDKAGLLDEMLFLYFEEPDFCRRVKAHGWEIVFYPEARIIHLHGKTMSKVGKSTQVHYRRSQLYYYQKYCSRIEQLALRQYLLLKYKKKMLLSKNAEEKLIWNEIIELSRKSSATTI